MLPEKPWKPEAVLLLGAGICFCALAGMVTQVGLQRLCPGLSEAQKGFLGYLIGMTSLQGAALVGMFGFLRLHEIGAGEAFGLARSRRDTLRAVVAGGGVVLVALPLTLLLGHLSELVLVRLGMAPKAQAAVKLLQLQPAAGQIIVMALGAIVLAPVAEEMLFRGIVYPTLKQSGHRQLALWVSALLFASIHVNLMAFVPLTFLALVLAWLYERTGNLLAPIVAHSVFNAANTILLVWNPPWIKTH
jgi:uncharacterized protein